MFIAVGQTTGKIFLVREANRVAASLQRGEPINFYNLELTPVKVSVKVDEDDNGDDVLASRVVDQTLFVSNKLSIKPDSRLKVREVQSVALEADGKVAASAEVEV